jgi:HD-GYP domain-containing protein (c-di-GMP phosphodiesterase class II)
MAMSPESNEALRSPGAVDTTSVVMAGRDDRLAIANAVREQSYNVAAAVLARSVRRPEINVGLELTALSFAERFADAIASGNWSILLTWIDDVCEKYSSMAVIPRMLCAGTSTVASVMSERSIGLANRRSELAVVEEEIERIAHRPRVAAARVTSDTLDEIDVVLGELVGRLEASDALTAEHSRAVSVWCTRISKRMALSPAQTIYISRCGLIHDIGKMTTPPEILTAPRRLTAPEMNVMRRHAEDGGAIITAIPLLAHHTPAVRGHHERLDGHGYPDGLSASAIPLSARIVAVADAFNAMIGNRPYRLPMRPTLALEELKRHRGTQFDPEVIDAMIDVLNRRA